MHTTRRFVLLTSVTALLTLQVGTAAFAAPATETGDAGRFLATAQQPQGSGPLDSIAGALTSGDPDLYRICLTGGQTFSANTSGTPGTLGDTQLFLFDQNGFGIEANDDGGSGLRARLPAGGLSPSAPGVYYLAITGYDNDATSNSPASAAGLIFPSFPFAPVYGPTGPGGSQPLADWTGGGGSGTYTIVLTGAVFCQPDVVCTAVPPPPPGAIIGTSGADSIVGTSGPDVIYAGAGNDRIAGLGGDDLIFAGAGDDEVSAGDGNDTVCGGDGNDSLAGGGGNDVLSGDGGLDRVTGDAGDDQVLGGPDADQLVGGADTDTCRTGGNAGDAADAASCETVTA